MHRRGFAAIGATFALALVVSACGNGSDSTGGGGALKIGVLTSLSGSGSGGFGGTLEGVRARFSAYTEDKGKCSNRTVQILKADDQSNAQGALTGTQKLIQQDKVYAVLEVSSLFYGASSFATTVGKKTPVIGGGFDGAKEWNNTKNNLFPVLPVPQYDKTYATFGEYLKGVGGTKIAGVASQSPSAKAALEASMRSSDAAGIKRGYVNTSVPYGSTDVGPIVLGIMKSGADVIELNLDSDTVFAVIAGLKQAGYQTKATVAAAGYGADLLESAPAVKIGQGVTFLTGWAPSELKTPGTERMGRALKKYAGSKSGIPSFSQGVGWLEADLFLHGLEKAGCNASQEKFISALRKDKTWTANSLYPTPRDFTTVAAKNQCVYFVRMQGTGFVLEPKATPICGALIR